MSAARKAPTRAFIRHYFSSSLTVESDAPATDTRPNKCLEEGVIFATLLHRQLATRRIVRWLANGARQSKRVLDSEPGVWHTHNHQPELHNTPYRTLLFLSTSRPNFTSSSCPNFNPSHVQIPSGCCLSPSNQHESRRKRTGNKNKNKNI